MGPLKERVNQGSAEELRVQSSGFRSCASAAAPGRESVGVEAGGIPNTLPHLHTEAGGGTACGEGVSCLLAGAAPKQSTHEGKPITHTHTHAAQLKFIKCITYSRAPKMTKVVVKVKCLNNGGGIFQRSQRCVCVSTQAASATPAGGCLPEAALFHGGK